MAATLTSKLFLSGISTKDAKKIPESHARAQTGNTIRLAQHRAQPASFKHHTKPGCRYVIHCDWFSGAQHEPGTLSSGSAKSAAEPEF